MPSVLVLGGGISGLSAAMELAADCDVTVVERRAIVGGKSRTWTDPSFDVFREHSFRVFHSSYHNLFDAMRRIPYGNRGSVFENLKPFIDRERLFATYPRTWEMYRRRGPVLGTWDRLLNVRDGVALLRLLTASEPRLAGALRDLPFEELFTLRDDGTRGLVFDVIRAMSQVEYSADRLNPDLRIMLAFLEKHFLHHPPGLGWFALDGPTSDSFLEPWRVDLERRGVRFRTGTEITAIHHDPIRNRIDSVDVRDVETDRTETLRANHYVSALTSDVLLDLASPDLLAAAPELGPLAGFRRVSNNGVLIFTSRRQELAGGYYLWHPWRIAANAYADRWSAEHAISRYGRGPTKGKIVDILTYCICDWEEPGFHVLKPAKRCTPDEIYEELCHAAAVDPTVVTNFDRADHVYPTDADGRSVRCLVDEALIYDETGSEVVHNEDTLVHIPAGGFYEMPGARTSIPNFVLAGCHCANDFNCGDNMESANETGRRAARAVLAAARGKRTIRVHQGRTSSTALRALGWIRAADRIVYGLTHGGKPAPSPRSPGMVRPAPDRDRTAA